MATEPASPNSPLAQDPSAHPQPEGPSLCDLVMKGGITSGVIYPKLVAELAAHYTFKNIGGTSAGAIAAGACAAAEYGRSHGRPDAFDELESLPELLGKPTAPSGRSKLFTLFQPAPALRAHFAVLVGALNLQPAEAVPRVVRALLKMHPQMVYGALLLGTLLGWPMARALAPDASWGAALGLSAFSLVLSAYAAALAARVARVGPVTAAGVMAMAAAIVTATAHVLLDAQGWLTGGAMALAMQAVALLVWACLLAVVVARFGSTLLRGVHANGYGICSGQTASPHPGALPGLTNWLAGYFNGLAGWSEDHRPLTFGDLWGTHDPAQPRQINLEVMTSAISQQMVYAVPFRDGTPRFFYDPVEWSRLFPANVLRWLDEADRAVPDGDGTEPPLPEGARVVSAGGRPLRMLPRRADLPVVVAVRMSLSFPVLLSGVPLYAVDWSRVANQHQKTLLEKAARGGAPIQADIVATRVWFSDGGIGSNMPLHLFDALLPSHPTFAVNLKAAHPDFAIREPERPHNDGGRIYLPDSNLGGRQRHWAEPADGKPLQGLIGFLSSIVDTMQNWRDEILFPYPGFRDRIVQISQRPTEGGLNLDMPPRSIADLAGAGAMAAGRLVDRFHPQGSERGKGWTNHQTVRLRTFLGTLQPGSTALAPSLARGEWAALLPNIKAYSGAERQLANDFLVELGDLGARGAASGVSLKGGALKPLAEIRISPRI